METTVRKLIDDGWLEYTGTFRDDARRFCKRFDTPTRCRCDDDCGGMYVHCRVGELRGRVTYELYLRGELSDGTRIELRQCVMPDDIAEGLAKIPRMLSAWEHIANVKDEPRRGCRQEQIVGNSESEVTNGHQN